MVPGTLGACLPARSAPSSADLAAQTFRSDLFSSHGFLLWNDYWYGGHYLPGYSVLFPPLGAASARGRSGRCRRSRRPRCSRPWPGAPTVTAPGSRSCGSERERPRCCSPAASPSRSGSRWGRGRSWRFSGGARRRRPARRADLVRKPGRRPVRRPGGRCCGLRGRSPRGRRDRRGGGRRGARSLAGLPDRRRRAVRVLGPGAGAARSRRPGSSSCRPRRRRSAGRSPSTRSPRSPLSRSPTRWAATWPSRRTGGGPVLCPRPDRPPARRPGGPRAAAALLAVGGARSRSRGGVRGPVGEGRLLCPAARGAFAPHRGGARPDRDPPTRNRWEATYVAPRFSLARGWLRQLESDDFDLFTDGNLSPSAYRAWLYSRGVGYVAVSDAEPDYLSRDEEALIATRAALPRAALVRPELAPLPRPRYARPALRRLATR